MIKLETRIDVRGNPWPRPWQSEDQDLYNSLHAGENKRKCQSKLVIKSKSDFLMMRKYYKKNIKFICVSNVGLPKSLQKRYKYVRELKIFSNAPIKCRFANLNKLTLNIHAMSAEKNKNLSQIIRANKHIKSLKISNLDTFQILISAIKCCNSLETFYIDINDHSLKNVAKHFPNFLKRNFKLQKLGAFIKDIWSDGDTTVDRGYRKVFDSIVNSHPLLKILKLDVSLKYCLSEENGDFVNYLLSNISAKSLEKFDVRISVPQNLIISPEINNLMSQADYFAITTAGESVLSVFSDSAERLSLQKKSNKLLMLNFEGQKKLNLVRFLECPLEQVKTLDLQFKHDNLDIGEFGQTQKLFSQLKNIEALVFYFDSCSLYLAELLELLCGQVKNFQSLSHSAVLFQNIIYDQEIYSTISKFLRSLNNTTYLNLMLYHNLRLNKSSHPKIEIDSICQTISSLPKLKTIKFAANPPWDSRPVLGFAPILSSLPQLESLTVFLWLKTDAKDENKILLSFPIPVISKLKDLAISIYFKLEDSFFASLSEQLSHAQSLESLTLSLAYYNRIDLNQFKLLLKKLSTLKNIKQIQLSLNIAAEERENKIERLQEAMRRGHHQPFDVLVSEMNEELRKERKDIKREVVKLFEEVTSIKSITFMHAAKQYFSLTFKR